MERTRIWVAAAVTEGSDGHSRPASPENLSGAARFGVRNASNLLSAQAQSSSPGTKKCQLFFEAGGLETARAACRVCAECEELSRCKTWDTQSCLQSWFWFFFLFFAFLLQPQGLYGANTIFTIAKWIVLSLLVKRPRADVLASGARGTGLPRNPVRAISSDVTVSPFP